MAATPRASASSRSRPVWEAGSASTSAAPATCSSPSISGNEAMPMSTPQPAARAGARFSPRYSAKRRCRRAEAVPLVGIKHVRHGDAPLLHGRDDLIRLGLLHAGIVGALADQQRAANLIDVRQRRPLRQKRPALLGAMVADARGEQLHLGLPESRKPSLFWYTKVRSPVTTFTAYTSW